MRYIKSFQNDAAIQEAIDNKTLGKPYIALNESAGTIDWNGKEIDYSNLYLTIEALSGGTFYVRKANIGYSVNGGAWETTTGETALALNQGDAVRFKGTAGGNSLFTGNTLAHNAYGNIESLEYGDDYKGQTAIKNSPSTGAFGFMFYSASTRNAKNLILPATTLKGFCYYAMFQGCKSITKVPELPATALTSNCYAYMFSSCRNLGKAPDLPAPTLSTRSYYYMFNNDVALRYIKCLATNPEATNGGVAYWVQGVTRNVGTFVKKAGVNWPTGNSGIPEGWTVIEE